MELHYQSYGVLLAIWDHTVLPVILHKWTCICSSVRRMEVVAAILKLTSYQKIRLHQSMHIYLKNITIQWYSSYEINPSQTWFRPTYPVITFNILRQWDALWWTCKHHVKYRYFMWCF